MNNTIERAVRKTETQEHAEALAENWNKLGWSDEFAKIKCEESDLDYITVVLVKSELLENLA